LQQTMSVSRGKQERSKTRTLTRAAEANYRVLGVTPVDVPLLTFTTAITKLTTPVNAW
jgi:hypothetical protein